MTREKGESVVIKKVCHDVCVCVYVCVCMCVSRFLSLLCLTSHPASTSTSNHPEVRPPRDSVHDNVCDPIVCAHHLQKSRSSSPRPGDTVEGVLLPASKAIEYKGSEGVVIKSTARTSHSVDASARVSRSAFRSSSGSGEGRSRTRSPRLDIMSSIKEALAPVAPPRMADALKVPSPRVAKSHKV